MALAASLLRYAPWLAAAATALLALRWLRRCLKAPHGLPGSERLERHLRFVLLALGTRGDVQPLVALALALRRRGHEVVISGSTDFRPLVERVGGPAGVTFESCGIDKVEQPKEWLTAKSMTEFMSVTLRDTVRQYAHVGRGFYRAAAGQDVPGAVDAGQGGGGDGDGGGGTAAGGKGRASGRKADVVVCSLFTQQFGMDIAEALGVPCWVTKLAPDEPTWEEPPFGGTRSRRFSPTLQRLYNRVQHTVRFVDMVRAAGDTKLTEVQNDFRQRALQLPAVGLGRLTELSYTPTVCGYSSHVAPRPRDWAPWVGVSGYWFLDDTSFEPAPELRDFLSTRGGTRGGPVCVNFGSMALLDQTDLIMTIVRATVDAGHRCLLVTGWGATPDPALLPQRVEGAAPSLDDEPAVLCIREAPHEWLFPKCAAVVYHGGAGTVARVLHAGVPSVIVPILKFYDQCGWADAVEDRGAGYHVRDPTLARLIPLIATAAAGRGAMCEAAARIGRSLAPENGVDAAVEMFETCLCRRVGLTDVANGAYSKDDAALRMCQRHCLACRYRALP